MKPPSANKTKAKLLKWGLGGALTILLFWQVWVAAKPGWQQWQEGNSLIQPDLWPLAVLALLLLPVNILLDARKWQILVRTTQKLTFGAAAGSVLAGLAGGFITPNRLGEYPGRILYLKLSKNSRLLSVSLLGIVSQLAAVLLCGTFALVYYTFWKNAWWGWPALAVNTVLTIFLLLVYFRFERWAPRLERWRWLRKWNLQGAHNPLSSPQQWLVLFLSVLRFATYTFQYYLVLCWLGLPAAFLQGILAAILFFWTLTVVPTIALAELGIRSGLGLFLFLPLGANGVAVILATTLLWLYNMALPALPAVFLIWRRKLLINSRIKPERNGI